MLAGGDTALGATPWWLCGGQTLLEVVMMLPERDTALGKGTLVALGAKELSCGCQELCLQLKPQQSLLLLLFSQI